MVIQIPMLRFTCEQCLGSFSMVRQVMRHVRCGFMCETCWMLFHRRIQEIVFPHKLKKKIYKK